MPIASVWRADVSMKKLEALTIPEKPTLLSNAHAVLGSDRRKLHFNELLASLEVHRDRFHTVLASLKPDRDQPEKAKVMQVAVAYDSFTPTREGNFKPNIIVGEDNVEVMVEASLPFSREGFYVYTQAVKRIEHPVVSVSQVGALELSATPNTNIEVLVPSVPI